MRFKVLKEELIDYLRKEGISFSQMATVGHVFAEIRLPDFITLEGTPVEEYTLQANPTEVTFNGIVFVPKGEPVEEEDALAEYSCGKCIHYKTYEFCQCKCHNPSPQLPEELNSILHKPLNGSDKEVIKDMWTKINDIIRYLKHHERN